MIKILFFRSTTQLKQLSGTLQSNLNTLQSGKPGFHNFTKDLNACSWRAVAIFFIVLTIAMASTLAFVIGEFAGNWIQNVIYLHIFLPAASTLVTPSQTDIAKACAVVDTLKDENLVTQFEDLSRSPPRPGKYLHNLVRSQMWTHQSILGSPGWLLVPCIGLSIITCSHIYLHNLPLRSTAHREFLNFEQKYNKKRIKNLECHIKKE